MRLKGCILLIILIVKSFHSFGQMNLVVDTTFNYACNGIPCNYSGPSILINEIMVSPNTGDGSISGGVPPSLGVGDGEWIELYNPDLCEAIDISCYYLGNFTFEGSGGFLLPQGTVIPPSGFCLIRGVNAPSVPPNLLVQNGGRVVEIVVPPSLNAPGVCSSGNRVWFPNAGGWFAFYDSNGVPQDAVRWGSSNTADLGGTPCIAQGLGCSAPMVPLVSYNNIPANRKTHASTMDASDHKDLSIRRIPDGGNWAGIGAPTFANCNAPCIPPGASSCNGSATVQVTGGTPPFSFQWNDPDNQTTQTASDLCAGTYTVTVTDANGNTQNTNVKIHNFIPTVNFSAGDTLCLNHGDFFFQEYSPIGGPNDVVTFIGNGINNNIFNSQAAGVGTHEITYIFEDEFKCTNSDIDSITVIALPETSITNINNPYCVDETDAGLILSPSNGTLGGNGTLNNIFNPSLAGVGEHQVYFYFQNGDGCTDTTFATISVVDLPNISILGPNEFCLNDGLSPLSAVPAGGEFSIQQTPLSAVNPASLGVGQHEIVYAVTDNNGCFNEASKTITIHPIPTIEFDPEYSEGCPPWTVSFSANAPTAVNCFWTLGNDTLVQTCGTVTHSFLSGCHDVQFEVIDINGCTNTSKVQDIVCVFPQPEANFAYSPDPLTEFFTEAKFINLSQDADIFWWTFENGVPGQSIDTHPTVQFPEEMSGNYLVTLEVTSEFGCTDAVSRLVPVLSDVLIYVPNTFTPDGDAFNNLWEYSIEGISPTSIQIEIYNRWGEQIWQSNELNEFWDGTFNGKLVKQGTYVWRITASDNHTAEKFLWTGHVNVLY
ncbi:MAG: gliding motility-associated C-terminal domain-containing protein [Crocinitomicaceae bacterium]|nr:gliding motility-associated C-terminal domain-containing protein [Crocinitomicaceae bacterium]